MLQRPDRFRAGGEPSDGTGPPLDLSAGQHGDIHWDNDTYTMSYLGEPRRNAASYLGMFASDAETGFNIAEKARASVALVSEYTNTKLNECNTKFGVKLSQYIAH